MENFLCYSNDRWKIFYLYTCYMYHKLSNNMTLKYFKYLILIFMLALIFTKTFSQEIDSNMNVDSTVIINNISDQPNNNSSNNLISIVSIICVTLTSIGVAYFSGLFSRKTEFDKNIIQKRIELFTSFMKDYEPYIRTVRRDIANENITHKNGIQIVDDKIVSEKEKLQWPITSKIKVIKLILNAKDRDNFNELYISIKNLINNSYLDGKPYFNEIDEKYAQIEKIFYENLTNVNFNQKTNEPKATPKVEKIWKHLK